MRHVLVHDYANIVSETLFDTAVNDIPPLRQQVERYLAETDWDEWVSLPDEFDDNYEENMIKTAYRMKAKGYPIADITEITGMTAEEIERL